MKIELSHDSLAKNIYERASMEDKSRLKARNFIKTRYAFYPDNRALLKKDELNYIKPYLSKIELQKGEREYIRRSQLRLNMIRWGTWGMVLGVIVGLVVVIVIIEMYREKAVDLKGKMEAQKDLVMEKKDSLNKVVFKFEEEERKRKELQEKLSEGNEELSATKEDLQEAYADLKKERDDLAKKEEELIETNAELKKTQAALAALNKKLEKDNQKLVVQTQTQKNTINKSQSRALSAKALYAMRHSNDPKLAFQLATRAYELDKNNKEACAVLDEINTGRRDYINRINLPGRTTEQIIQRHMSKYGTLSRGQEQKYLQGMPPESLQQRQRK